MEATMLDREADTVEEVVDLSLSQEATDAWASRALDCDFV